MSVSLYPNLNTIVYIYWLLATQEVSAKLLSIKSNHSPLPHILCTF